MVDERELELIETISYPKDPAENLRWRTKLLRRARVNLEFREMLKRLFYEDILFAFNAFFYTLDVRRRPHHHQPFCTYSYQDVEILALRDAINRGEDKCLEKSRDMGVTWIVLGTMFWFWCQPSGGADFLLGSRIEDYVDKKGDPRTHFAKLRYLLNRLPKWLRPKGFNPRSHDTFMKLVNPVTESSFTGESNNPNFSTQGRYLAILYDEFAKWEGSDESAWTAGGDASPSRIAVSTPFGAGGQFYRLVTDGRTRKATLHWSLHPRKARGLSCLWPTPNEHEKGDRGASWSPEEKLTSPWYEGQCKRRLPSEIAQELDIDYLGAGRPVFEGKAWEMLKAWHKRVDEPVEFLAPHLYDFTTESIGSPSDWEGYIVVYEKCQNLHSYAVGTDVVEGVEAGDYAFIVVLDRSTKNIVAVYWSRLDEIQLASVILIVSRLYTSDEDALMEPWVGIEAAPGPGLATFDKAFELGVSNLFMPPRYDVTNGSVSFKKGWRTDKSSRAELVAGVREYLLDRAGNLNSQRLVGELMTFVYNKVGKPIAKGGCRDDGVMAFGIALQVDEIAPLEEKARKAKILDLRGVMEQAMRKPERMPVISTEELCLATVMKKKAFKDETSVLGEVEEWL